MAIDRLETWSDMNKPESEFGLNVEAADTQLARVLEFAPRADSKLSLALGVGTAMLGVLASRAPAFAKLQWPQLIVLMPIVLIAISLFYVYRGLFPRLEGGQNSLIYFGQIADLTESTFIKDWAAFTDESYVADVLAQVHRNSEIVAMKYNATRQSYVFLAWSIVPWAISFAFLIATA